MNYSKILLVIGLIFLSGLSNAASDSEQYGSAKFESYKDIDSVKQLKVVWDFNFQDPKAVNGVFNNLAALLKATAEFGPHDFEPIKVVIVSHGPVINYFALNNIRN